MEKRILSYRKYMDELLKKEDADWRRAASEHLIQVGFFQHERLIHLLVTITFALLEMLALFMAVLSFSPAKGLFVLLILVLLVPYIRHYYILENEVQKMYAQYDELVKRIGAGGKVV